MAKEIKRTHGTIIAWTPTHEIQKYEGEVTQMQLSQGEPIISMNPNTHGHLLKLNSAVSEGG